MEGKTLTLLAHMHFPRPSQLCSGDEISLRVVHSSVQVWFLQPLPHRESIFSHNKVGNW